MAILSDVSKMLSSDQGTLIYYLLVFWAVVAGLAMALGEWQRTRDELAQRLLLAMGGLVLVRAVYAIVALLAGAGWIDGTVFLPPLERFVTTSSLCFLAWAFMPLPRRGVHTWDWVFGLNLALAVAVCLGFTVQWGQALAADASLGYNTFWQETVWLVWQIGLILVAGVAAVWSREDGWGAFLAAMIVLLVGNVLQLVLLPEVAHVPVWQRLASLVAYPLIAVGVYLELVGGLRVRSSELRDLSQASLDEIKSLLSLFEAGQQMSSTLDVSAVLDNAVQGIARVLDADQCAIVFPEEGDSGTMRLVAICNPLRQGRGEAVTFPLDYQLTVQQAIRRRKPVLVPESDNIQLKILFALLGSAETGPLLVQPLLTDKEAIGAFIAGNSRSRRAFTPSESKLSQSLAEQVVAAIQNARLYEAARGQIQVLNKAQADGRRELQAANTQIQELNGRLAEAGHEIAELKQYEEAVREARQALEAGLVGSRAETDALTERLAVLETDLAQAHANAEAQLRWHEEEVARLRTDWEQAVQSAESARAILKGMTAGILITDEQGVIQEANVAAEMLLDLGADQLVGIPLKDILADPSWQRAVAAAGGGEASRFTMPMGGNRLLCDMTPLPVAELKPAEAHRLMAIIQDISAETSAEPSVDFKAEVPEEVPSEISADIPAEIEEQRKRLEAAASLAEELRTPITTIANYADLLLGEEAGGAPSGQRRYLSRIKTNAERLAQMADKLIQAVGSGELLSQPQRRLVDLNNLIKVSVVGSQSQLDGRGVTVEVDLATDLPAVQADPDALRRVMSNLLSNACLASGAGAVIQVQSAESSHSPSGSGEAAANGDGFVEVSVRDSGGGLSAEALKRTFDEARPSQTPSGLGESGAELALVKTLVEEHGGRLWVESQKGAGTTFRFTLPVNDAGDHSERRIGAVV
jgi:signal transduction histidine kinase/GAF domain-containing protein